MKHFRILLPLLILALMLSACGQQSQAPYTFMFSRNNQEKTLRIDPEAGTIRDGTDVYHYQMEVSGNRTSYEIRYPNGAIFHWTGTEYGGAGGWSDHLDDTNYISAHILLDALEVNAPREKVGNVGIGLLLIGLGALNFFCPELPFYLRYGWAVENAEPSDAYITWAKAGGVITVVLGLIWCFV